MKYAFHAIRSALCFLVFIPYTFLVYLCSFIPFLKEKRCFSRFYQSWSAVFVWVFGIRKHIHPEYTALPEHFIMISNHPAGIDVIWLPSRFNVRPLSKKDVLNWPLVGRIAKKGGVLFVDRGRLSSRKASLDACAGALKEGENILIFPEGGCIGRGLNPFQRGAFELSVRTGIPVLPVYIRYEAEETYAWEETGTLSYIARLLFGAVNRNAHLHIFDYFKPGDYSSSEEYKNAVFHFYTSLEKTLKNGTQR